MKSYFIESMSWTVGGHMIWSALAINDLGLKGFRQYFERAWTPIKHSSPVECLKTAREMLPNTLLFLNESESEILIATETHVEKLYRIAVNID